MEESKFQYWMLESKWEKDVETLKAEVTDLDSQIKELQDDRKELLIQNEETRNERDALEQEMNTKIH